MLDEGRSNQNISGRQLGRLSRYAYRAEDVENQIRNPRPAEDYDRDPPIVV